MYPISIIRRNLITTFIGGKKKTILLLSKEHKAINYFT